MACSFVKGSSQGYLCIVLCAYCVPLPRDETRTAIKEKVQEVREGKRDPKTLS
jgi:hypothetical protein